MTLSSSSHENDWRLDPLDQAVGAFGEAWASGDVERLLERSKCGMYSGGIAFRRRTLWRVFLVLPHSATSHSRVGHSYMADKLRQR
jgi:hypothetical protein